MNQLFRKYSGAAVPILIAITALIIYSNTLSSPFHFDDVLSIEKNDVIRSLSNFLDLSGTRYAGDLSFALNYHMGQLNVFGYHLVNVLIHIINGILVWWLVKLIFKTPVMARSAVSPQLISAAALASALIFVAHPVQTQAVTYIVQRYASLATLFFLLSITLFAKWRITSGNRYRVMFYLFSLFSAVLAMKTKEISFTLPFIILLYDFIFFRDTVKRIHLLIPYILTLPIIPLSIMSTDRHPGGIVGKLGEAVQETETISRGDYLITQFRVIVTYIRLLFFPVNQNLDYDYPVYNSIFIPEVFLSFLFLLVILGLAVYLLMRSYYIVSFGIFWFFITLSVESGLIPIRDVIFEHRLYLPSIGAGIAFSYALFYGIEKIRRRRGVGTGAASLAVWILILFLIAPLSYAAWQRNSIWKDGVTLWGDVVAKSPLKARGHYNLGLAYFRQGRIDDAIEGYKAAIRLKPDYDEAYNNLGLAYVRQGRIGEAIGEFRTALRLKPSLDEAHINLGLAYIRLGRLDEAIGVYREALRLKPTHVEAYNNLGLAYIRQGRLDEAIGAYRNALRLKPTYAEAYNNLGLAYVMQDRVDEAIGEFTTALRLKPDYEKARSNLDIAYEIKKAKARGDR